MATRRTAAPEEGYFQGKFLIATPSVGGSFSHSVIFVVSHSEEGAMGIIINRPLTDVAYGDVYEQLGLEDTAREAAHAPVHFGGPVETNRGFVLYAPKDHQSYPDSIVIQDGIAVSASAKLLEAIARGEGPAQHMLTVGYAGWGAGQLEQEIEENSWIVAPDIANLVFDGDHESKWQRAAFSLGVDPMRLSMVAGHA